MKKHQKQYSAAIFSLVLGLLGAALVFLYVRKGHPAPPRTVFLFLTIAALVAGAAECLVIRMPQYGIIPAADVFYYVVIAVGSPLFAGGAALVAAVIKAGCSLFSRDKKRGNGYFYLVQAPLTFFAGGLLYQRLAGPGNFAGGFYRSFTNLGALFVTAFLCLVIRHVLNAAYLAFLGQVRWSYVWRFQPRRIHLYLLTIIPISILIIITYQVNPLALALLAPPLALVYFSIKRYADLLYEAKSTMEILAEAIEARDPFMIDHGERGSPLLPGNRPADAASARAA